MKNNNHYYFVLSINCFTSCFTYLHYCS